MKTRLHNASRETKFEGRDVLAIPTTLRSISYTSNCDPSMVINRASAAHRGIQAHGAV